MLVLSYWEVVVETVPPDRDVVFVRSEPRALIWDDETGETEEEFFPQVSQSYGHTAREGDDAFRKRVADRLRALRAERRGYQ